MVLVITGFLQVRENWKMSGNLCCQGKSGKNIISEKSGKMIFDHADGR